MPNNWTIPGTTLQIDKSNAPRVAELFQSMFLSGGMVLSQVANITGLGAITPYMQDPEVTEIVVQRWNNIVIERIKLDHSLHFLLLTSEGESDY